MDVAQKHNLLGWLGIFRIGLVQAALGAIVILTTSTLNRVMIVELMLPALLPGALVGWHYAVQLSRPRWGYGSDVSGTRTPWIIGGMVALAIGAVSASAGTLLLQSMPVVGVLTELVSFFIIGVGVGSAGTNLLALLATKTPPARKAAAAAIAWIMMIVGFVITAIIVGAMLDPFSLFRLIQVTTIVSIAAVAITILSIWGVEKRSDIIQEKTETHAKDDFKNAFLEIWSEPQAKRFTIFVFISMLAYSAQDLVLEPFAGLIYGYTPGESTSLAGTQNLGVLLGMIGTATIGTVIGKSRQSFMRQLTIFGCLASAAAMTGLCLAAVVGPTWPLQPTVFALGIASGIFTIGAISSMMTLAGEGSKGREGIRMGMWGASQAIAFGLGGLVGAAVLDLARAFLAETAPAFAIVFALEAILFLAATGCAIWVGRSPSTPKPHQILQRKDILAIE